MIRILRHVRALWLRILFLALLLGVCFTSASAQVDPGPCDTCWDGFVPDFDFRIYGHIVQDHAYAHDEFHFDGAQIYQKNIKQITQMLNDTSASTVVWVDDPTHPWGGFWNDDALDADSTPATIVVGGVDEIKSISYYLDRVGFHDALERGYGIIAVPEPLGNFKGVVRTLENFLVLPDEFQNLPIGTNPTLAAVPDSIKGNRTATIHWLQDQYDSLAGGFFSAYKISGSATPDTALIAALPTYTVNTFYAASAWPGDPMFMKFLYDPAYHYWTDENGNPRSQSETDSILAQNDLRASFEIDFAMRTNLDSLNRITPPIDDNDMIAYAPLYYREIMPEFVQLDTTFVIGGANIVPDTISFRDSCRCNIMRPFDTIRITKGLYLERFEDSTNKYVAHKDGRSFEIDKDQWYYDIGRNVDFRDTAVLKSVVQQGPFGISPSATLTLQYDSVGVSGDTVTLTMVIPHPGVAKCDSLIAARRALHLDSTGWLPPGTRQENFPTESNFNYELFSTRIVPIDFYRNSIRHQSYALIRDGLADHIFDTIIADIYADPLTDSLISHIGVLDEPTNFSLRTYGLLSSQMQRAMERHPVAKDRPKPIWTNPAANLSSFPLLGGDYDSTTFRMVQTSARQAYGVFGHHPTPVMYANPDSLGVRAWDTIYRAIYNFLAAGGDTTYPMNKRWVAGNSTEDYEYYTGRIQGEIFGNFGFRYGATVGETITGTSWLVEVLQLHYRDRFPNLPPTPVWNVVQTHGRPNIPDSGPEKEHMKEFGVRHTTPEEMIGMAWLSMNSGVNGIVFGDFQTDGENSGPLTQFIQPDNYDNLEYGRFRYTNQSGNQDADPQKRIDSMWLGYRTRHAALREVTAELTYIDSVIGWKNLRYNLEQISVNNLKVGTQGHETFSTVPMIADLKAERAKHHDVTWDSTSGTWTFEGSDTLDPFDETYIEVTHFTDQSNPDSRAVLITNRRTWPVDLTSYGQKAADRFADFEPENTFSTTGLGAIDVRRPLVVFENNTDVLADSLIVQRISPTSTWSDTVAFGDTVKLEWMLPGRGHLYRLTPLAVGVSEYGVAYNNAVRSENTATDTDEGYQVAVYERDSAIYLRTYTHPVGWSREFLMSDPDDTVRVSGLSRRLAHNMLPAVARARDDSAVLVVWQRLDTNDQGTIHALHIPGSPVQANINSATRLKLSTDRTIDRDWMTMSPAVVGMEGGWLIAWGSPRDGIEVAALRNEDDPNETDDLSLVGTVKAEYLIYPSRNGLPDLSYLLDSIAMYPTLAYVPNQQGEIHFAHLAWQQGADSSEAIENQGPFIIYKQIGVQWKSGTTPPSLKMQMPEEHVSQSLPGCRFYHPSIAADSLRVGVAFESRILGMSMKFPTGIRLGEVRPVTLRFRDSLKDDANPANARPWSGPAYYWGDSSTSFVYPSLTEFPLKEKFALLSAPEGALVWFDTKDGTSQWSYRYGNLLPERLSSAAGGYPTLMLAPRITNVPLEETGVLYRETSSFTRPRGWGETGTYYPGRMLTSETSALDDLEDIFTVFPRTNGINSHFTMGSLAPMLGFCDFAILHAGMAHDFPHHEDWETHDTIFGMPGTFFSDPQSGATWIDEPEDASRIARSGTFPAGTAPSTIKRYIGRTSNLVTWLNTFPYDTVMLSQPDVKILTELVRAGDGAVLWRDDTISVRSMTGDELAESVSVPTDMVSPAGTMVYVQLRAVPTMEMEYSLSAGFQFYDETTVWGGIPKRSSPWRTERKEEVETGETALAVRVVPNPARDRAEVRVATCREETVRVTVWSLKGETLAELPSIHAECEGEYVVEIDLANVKAGTYLLKAQSGTAVVSTQFVVVK